jgi:hypothetical protein
MNWNLLLTLLLAFTLWRIMLEPLLNWWSLKCGHPINPNDAHLATLNKQLTNLYTLIAFNSKLTPRFDPEGPSGLDIDSTERLKMWRRVAEFHRVGQGMSFDEAENSVFELEQKQQAFINSAAPSRIKHGCHGAQLCPKCQSNLEKAEAKLKEIETRPKAGVKPQPHTDRVVVPPCELPYSQWPEWKKNPVTMTDLAVLDGDDGDYD